jgi:hypothetical protein
LNINVQLDKSLYPTKLLIGFKNLISDHTGSNIRRAVLDIVDTYKITAKIGCFVGDNALNNDSVLIEALSQHPHIDLTNEHRIRCTGYIINLVVKATIYGDGVSL